MQEDVGRSRYQLLSADFLFAFQLWRITVFGGFTQINLKYKNKDDIYEALEYGGTSIVGARLMLSKGQRLDSFLRFSKFDFEMDG